MGFKCFDDFTGNINFLMQKTKFTKQDAILAALVSLSSTVHDIGNALRFSKDFSKKNFSEHLKNEISDDSFYSILSRLKKQGLIEKSSRGWNVTKLGRHKSAAAIRFSSYADFAKSKNGIVPNTIIIFDIPEQERVKRNTLREDLKALGFNQLQKSVWMGWSPLPAAFVSHIKSLGIVKFVHLFTIQKSGTLMDE
ncbi:MAG: hypothetical protein COU07_01285 [Candidatus Harrisonbacteria bacterium CG10_big_fil_rev_8_21_14_0_10_40_38]|uniref:Transcriptional repressor PaaX-like central Cas2-like domain-containing protein n=1 Tax=Candidatus Harrisonbacteria bacterium CG10_big_fil_rev_8_21_14_0_10_40_38 TaxID=1974583 RepID=A0A2H0UV31_9BACT|nr:MAG: hypothetical protein COU07_01285 [Candidatus Harrisonbacteria bacterium CG10_big_fil_rev_8_21_14_0_10_40_38]